LESTFPSPFFEKGTTLNNGTKEKEKKGQLIRNKKKSWFNNEKGVEPPMGFQKDKKRQD